MINIYTIGVYGFSENDFFAALQKAQIDIFVDIRRRRGVRGSQYKFANSNYLQNKLNILNITYIHYLDLAPTVETRKKQKEIDQLTHTQKRKRLKLSQDFIDSYRKINLKSFDFDKFISSFGKDVKNIVLFCVERYPEACHRSIVAEYIKQNIKDINIFHII